MATGRSRSAAALARAEAHLAQARLPGKGRQNRLQGPPETRAPLLDGRPRKSHPESSPSARAPPGPSRAGPRSLVRSLDELFSTGDDPPSDSSTSTDFRANVLSLDDLVPAAASEAEKLKEKAVLTPAASPGTFHVRNTSEGVAMSPEEESAEDPGDTDISEQLSGSSGEASSRVEATPGSGGYSEDFESCSSSAAAEETERPSSSSGDEQSSPRDASLPSGRPDFSSPGSRKPQRKATKDATVQTSFPSFAHQGWWSAADAPFVGQTAEGPTTAGALPATGCFLSPAVLEAVTTYSPAAAALNDMAKQNLLLVRQFAETSQRLRTSMVASLDEERFHYHTLEEARRYISCHKPPPLTLEQALKELEEEEQDRAG